MAGGLAYHAGRDEPRRDADRARSGPGSAGALTAAGPLEEDAIWSSQWDEARAQELATEASDLVKARGWRCDSVSNLQAWVYSRGFDVSCNGFRYAYEIEDQGGTWVATLK